MEEFNTLHAYSVRIDLSHNQVNFNWILSSMEPDFYIIGWEHKENGIPHFQGCLFYKKKLEKRHLDKYKLRIKRNKNLLLNPTADKQNQYAFKIARDKIRLASYCNKMSQAKNAEKGTTNISTNLKKSTIEKIPEWIDKKTLKKALAKTKKKALEDYQLHLVKDLEIINPTSFHTKMIEKYVELYNSVPRYNTQIIWLYNFTNNPQLKSHLIGKMSCGLIPRDESSYNNQYDNVVIYDDSDLVTEPITESLSLA